MIFVEHRVRFFYELRERSGDGTVIHGLCKTVQIESGDGKQIDRSLPVVVVFQGDFPHFARIVLRDGIGDRRGDFMRLRRNTRELLPVLAFVAADFVQRRVARDIQYFLLSASRR